MSITVRTPIRGVALLSAALALSACEKKEAAPPPPPPPTSQVSAPPAAPASAPAPAAAAALPFKGKVVLGAGIGVDQVKPTDVLFVMARHCVTDCTKPGSLVAVHRVEKPTFPVEYTIGAEQVMMQGMPFVGPFVVQARLDRDGDPMTKGPEDLYAEVTSGVVPGQAGIDLSLGKTPSTPPVNPARPPVGEVPPGHAPVPPPAPAGH